MVAIVSHCLGPGYCPLPTGQPLQARRGIVPATLALEQHGKKLELIACFIPGFTFENWGLESLGPPFISPYRDILMCRVAVAW